MVVFHILVVAVMGTAVGLTTRFFSPQELQDRFGDGQTTMDQRTAAACASAKTAGIKIYSIRVINGNSSLLRGCASETSMFYEVSNASQLGPIFQQIAREISQIRLTM